MGGGVQDAINELCGGWNTPMPFPNPGSPLIPNPGSQEETDMDLVRQYVLEKYYFKDPKVLDEAIGLAFAYDSALMMGQRAYLADLQQRLKAHPAMKKLVDYIRRVAHRGNSKPPKMTKAERAQLKAAAASRRVAHANALTQSRWWGSNPYLPGSNKLAGTYKGLYLSAPRGKDYIPAWYAPNAMARYRRMRVPFGLDPVKEEKMV